MEHKCVIDTSSLLMLARYFHPFDDDKVLAHKIQQGFMSKSLILLQSVFEESDRVAQQLVVKTFAFLTDKELSKVKNNQLLEETMHYRLDNNWAIPNQKGKFSNEEYTQQKSEYIKTADFQLVYYAIEHENTRIITEESRSQNDGKLFKKIPIICQEEKIPCKNISELLQELGLETNYQFSN